MQKDRRLIRTEDFAAVRRRGRSWADGLLVLSAKRNGLEISRVGFSVGKRVGNAVVRNKAKRRLREAVRLTPIREGWDLVVIARRGASTADSHSLSHSLTVLFRRAGILVPSQERADCSPKAS